MKRTEYSFGKIDFNGSRAVIPTKRKSKLLIQRLGFLLALSCLVLGGWGDALL